MTECLCRYRNSKAAFPFDNCSEISWLVSIGKGKARIYMPIQGLSLVSSTSDNQETGISQAAKAVPSSVA